MTVRYRHAESLLVRDAGDYVLLLEASGNALVQLSGTGPALWDLLAEPLTIEQTVRRIAATYSLAPEDIDDEVRQVVHGLVAAGVLETVGTP